MTNDGFFKKAKTMKPSIPQGGFFAWQGTHSRQSEIEAQLKNKGATTCSPCNGVVLACWSEFSGQQLWSANGHAVACDLALTNEADLRKLADLAPGQDCRPGELLWALYRKFGIDFIDRLRGAFAFALWDATEGTLHVVTDFYGIRPVVYTESAQGFAAASRIRQLEAAGFRRDINPEAVYQYLFFQAICSPVSIYRDVAKLEPGMRVAVQEGRGKVAPYYDIRYNTRDQSESWWRETIPAAIEQAFRHYVPAMAPEKTGCFLSGGTDSSTIAGYYTRLAAQPAKTFSIGFDDPRYNELDFARIAVQRFGTQSHEYLVTPADVLSLIEELPRIYDEPFGNASVVAAFYCALLAKQNDVAVMLGGDGGDEIFGGNERYVTNLVFQKYFQVPSLLRKAILEPALGVSPAIGPIHKAKRYVRRANMANPRRFYSYNLLAETDNAEIFQPDFLAQLDTDCFFKRAQALYDRAAPAQDTDRLLYLDMKFTITDNDLRKVTQMVEAAGLQVHFPFLDRDLVDFAAAIPPDLKVRPGKNRYVFKRAMEGFLPDEIIQKSKHGMGLPIARWFKEDKDLNQLLQDTVFSPKARIRQFVRGDYLDRLKQAFLADETAYYGDNLWVFLVLELWLNSHQ